MAVAADEDAVLHFEVGEEHWDTGLVVAGDTQGSNTEGLEEGGMEEVAEKKGADTLQITHYRCDQTGSNQIHRKRR